MRLSDVMSHAGLAGYAEIALILFFLAFVVAFLSYLVWFWMLRKYLASRLSVFSFLTPVFGVGFGVLLLDDPLDPRFVAGALLVMAGVVMVNFRR